MRPRWVLVVVVLGAELLGEFASVSDSADLVHFASVEVAVSAVDGQGWLLAPGVVSEKR